MHRRSRASSGRTRVHLAGALVATVVGASLAILLAGSAAGAAAAVPRTVTVVFDGSGPSPGSVSISDGDRVTFLNRTPQAGSISDVPLLASLLGPLPGQVQSQGVVVRNAAPSPFKLATYGSAVTVTYSGPRTVNYSAQYTFELVLPLGAASTQTVTSSGQIQVAAAPPEPASNPPSAQNPGAGQPGASHGGVPAAGGQRTGIGGGLSYQAPGPGVADQVVPHGTGGSAANARPQTPTGTGDDGLPQLSGDGGSGSALLDAATPKPGVGLPAVVAVVLLSLVTAALVRTLITHRRTATGRQATHRSGDRPVAHRHGRSAVRVP